MRLPARRDGTSPRWLPASGLTLMEMLVTLVLVSLATLLMFQMLGNYRIARERVQAQSGDIDRRALLHSWFADTVHALHIAEGLQFRGDARSFNGVTLAALSQPAGSATDFEWAVRAGDGSQAITYSENGVQRWQLSLTSLRDARFGYVDGDGNLHDQWPPALGQYQPLPAAIALLPAEGQPGLPLVAAVLGPRRPVLRVFKDEDI